VRLRAADSWQTRVVSAGSRYLSGSSRRQHFGLGTATRVDEIQIDLPSGVRTVLRGLAADRLFRITEGTEAFAEAR
jgi:hypothetical protein